MAKVLAALRRHWKKSTFGACLLGWGGHWLYGKHWFFVSQWCWGAEVPFAPCTDCQRLRWQGFVKGL
ncbi:hypothetical protein DUI87_20069 [Hirundo rustica rustica]|uniref:Uncharacterized protein n=1 Tax=Hirundo rustica rustica TaxID=333673 RepID=A0A3M0JPG5_HIRRU|nr:hypothetical protein DUI87_20069 [Hirundo rustica rustica]